MCYYTTAFDFWLEILYMKILSTENGESNTKHNFPVSRTMLLLQEVTAVLLDKVTSKK